MHSLVKTLQDMVDVTPGSSSRMTDLLHWRTTETLKTQKQENLKITWPLTVIRKGKSHKEKQRSQIVVQNRAGCGGVGR